MGRRTRFALRMLSAMLVLGALTLAGCGGNHCFLDFDPAQKAVAKLLDIEAIKRAQYTYAFNADHGNLDALMEVFAEDAVMEIAMPEHTGRVVGKEDIRKSLTPAVSPGKSVMHAIFMPSVSVSGDTASGAFYILNIAPSSMKCEDGQGAVVWRLVQQRVQEDRWQVEDYTSEILGRAGRNPARMSV